MAKEDLEKVTIRLTTGAKEKLNTLYPSLGYNKVIRRLVDNFTRGVEEKVSQQVGSNASDITVDEDVLDGYN